MIARWALLSKQVIPQATQRIQSSRELSDVSVNQYVNSRYLELINDATKSNLNEISRQILPNGVKLPLPDWATLQNGNVRLLNDGQIEIIGQLVLG